MTNSEAGTLPFPDWSDGGKIFLAHNFYTTFNRSDLLSCSCFTVLTSFDLLFCGFAEMCAVHEPSETMLRHYTIAHAIHPHKALSCKSICQTCLLVDFAYMAPERLPVTGGGCYVLKEKEK